MPANQAEPPSGKQFELRHGSQHAVVTEVGGGLREYTVAGRSLLDGYGPDEICTAARGAALLPWPNRLQDGRYEFQGHSYQTPLTEPEHQNAIHGLARWMNWRPQGQSPERVVMGLLLHPQDGYPFALSLEIDYRLSLEGLTVVTTGSNLGKTPLPYGAGHHPYVTVGTTLVDQATLQLPASARLELDERQNATGRIVPVAGTDLDFREARPIGSMKLDTAFGDLQRDRDGKARVRVAAPNGHPGLVLWMDVNHPFFMVFTGDSLHEVARRRRGLGIEPMTCAPNAFRTGQGLQVLAPGQSFSSAWGIETHAWTS